MFLAAPLNAHMQLVERDEHIAAPDQSPDDQAAAAERLAYVPSQSFTPVSPEGHAEAASLEAPRTRSRSK